MKLLLLFLSNIFAIQALNLNYLDPIKLQTKTSPDIQRQAAYNIISKYSNNVVVEVNPTLFVNNKDVFKLWTVNGELHIRGSTGIAAVWGFYYYLKKYCKSHIGWQVQNVNIPSPLPEVDEVVVANDRFRYYQNVCTASYSFLWWNEDDWVKHVEWMALNGINLSLAPIAQEAAWLKIYRQLGMTEVEIDEHFTGPAFLSWLRMGNVHGWGGPLLKSWHDLQKLIQRKVLDAMSNLGMIPVFPAFNGHVPRAFARLYPNATFFSVSKWNKFSEDYCCNLFLSPHEPLFKEIGNMFLKEVSAGYGTSHIYTADPFNEIQVEPWSTMLVQETAKAIFGTLSEYDDKAVWMVQNWMFVHNPQVWPLTRVQTFLTSVPNGRMLVLDLQSEQWPQYNVYQMYYGQPFIWCMLHNFGGTLGMFGNVQVINSDVYHVRDRVNSSMIGIGLTPEGINQNYVVYELMLETAWRKGPIKDLNEWVGDYAERRYGCNDTALAWRYLLKSVYNFNGLNKMRGKYVITKRPSFKIQPWAWYESKDILDALKNLVFISTGSCGSGFEHDLVDVTRQVLQYRIDQLYVNLLNDRFSNSVVFNASINRFLDAMWDMETILATNGDFTISNWLSSARRTSSVDNESYLYELNARNQVTLWGPRGEITDYACKQWAEMVHYYYRPRWSMFLSMALDAKLRNETFDERSIQRIVRSNVEESFQTIEINRLQSDSARSVALRMYEKWIFASDLDDLPMNIITANPESLTTLADTDEETESNETPTVFLLHSTVSN
ncbi:alpha-N-acetylglucosaminidase [Leptidea sinapis]|uniref:alpha-N-acetylglucosaminidase n=1 Tax=Leptidea sinapis TaxID=189913 RepID=UPI0021363EDF|nr:alpha-N-acetylglucosaminidase [Leptidea sinapis]